MPVLQNWSSHSSIRKSLSNSMMKWAIMFPMRKGKERKKLHELQTALSYTRLEMGRNHSYDPYGYAQRNGKQIQPTPQVRKWLTQLKEHHAFTGMEYYNESADEIDYYIKKNGNSIYLLPTLKKNLFLGIMPSSTPPTDKDGLKRLTDSTHGLPGNYHCGWTTLPKEKYEISLPVKVSIRQETFISVS